MTVGLAVAPLAARGAEPGPEPPPSNVEHIQYGVALVLETALAGNVCPDDATSPCILGSGGGLGLRAGYRSRDPWFFGGAYEFSRQDSSNLIRLAILQQLRFEVRYYLDRGTRTTPFAAGALGGMLYGGEWSASTGGGVACHDRDRLRSDVPPAGAIRLDGQRRRTASPGHAGLRIGPFLRLRAHSGSA
jgi:hypothetical protein